MREIPSVKIDFATSITFGEHCLLLSGLDSDICLCYTVCGLGYMCCLMLSFRGGCQMHGLIFVTWEKYLSEHFGPSLLSRYRAALGKAAATAPLVSHVYDDATLLAGVGTASRLTRLPADTLLRQFGCYFMLNGLTSHLCAYLLNQVRSGRELLLVMRAAHEQMSRTPDALTPPLFAYEALPTDPQGLTLIYDSPRKLCPVLVGAIEGAAARYREQVNVAERICMKKGAAACRFEIHFSLPSSGRLMGEETAAQVARRQAQQRLDDLVWLALPDHDGVTLMELYKILQQWYASPKPLRPSMLLEALWHLQYVGLVSSTANQQGDTMSQRRYWRAPTGKE
jgi:Haem-NO-binding